MKNVCLRGILFTAAIFPAACQTEGEPELAIQRGHSGSVLSVAWSRGFVVTGGSDHCVKIWDLETGKEIRSMAGHDSAVFEVAVSNDGKYIVSRGGADVRVWDFSTGKQLWMVHEAMSAVAVTLDGERVVCGGDKLKIFDIRTGKEISVLSEKTARVISISLNPDRKHVVTGNGDKTIRILELDTGKEIRRIQCPTEIGAVAVSPSSGRYILSGCGDTRVKWGSHEIKVWDFATGKEVRTMAGQPGRISSLAITGNEVCAISAPVDTECIKDFSIKVWDLSTGKEVRTLSGHTYYINSLALNTAGNFLFSVSSDGTIREWELSTGREVRRLSGHSCNIKSVVANGNGSVIASIHKNSIGLWEPAKGEMRELNGHSDEILAFAMDDTGKYGISGSRDKTAVVWSIETGKPIHPRGDVTVRATSKIDKDGKFVVMEDSGLKLWKIRNDEKTDSFSVEKFSALFVVMTDDSKYVVAKARDKTVTMWEVSTGKEICTISGHRGIQDKTYISILEENDCYEPPGVTPDGRYVVSSTLQGPVSVWDTATGKEICALKDTKMCVTSLVVTPDGKYVVTGDTQNTIRVWELPTGKEYLRLSGHSAAVTSVTTCTGGKYIVSGSEDGSIRFWNLESGKMLGTVVEFLDGEWIFFTPDRRFDCSLNGAQYCGWVVGLKYYSFEQFEERYRVRGLARQVLAPLWGEKTVEPAVQTPVDKSLPIPAEVVIVSPSDGEELKQPEVDVKIMIIHNKGIKQAELFVNGKETAPRGITVTKKEDKRFGLTLTAQLVPGENVIGVQAIDVDSVKSRREEVRVIYKPAQTVKPELWILAVGISDYDDASLKLDYGASDAKRFVDILKSGSSELYQNAHSTILLDKDATTRNIKKAFSEISKNSAPQDVVMIFLAGHGDKDGKGNYYFITCDTDKDDLFGTAFQWRDIEGGIEQISAQKVVLLADTCHSGDVTKGRGVYEDTQMLVEKLVKSSGVALLVSSTGKEQSLESKDWGGGAFTAAVCEALSNKDGKVDSDKDGGVSVLELQQYVTRRVIEITSGKQHPYIPPSPKGYSDFPLVKLR